MLCPRIIYAALTQGPSPLPSPRVALGSAPLMEHRLTLTSAPSGVERCFSQSSKGSIRHKGGGYNLLFDVGISQL